MLSVVQFEFTYPDPQGVKSGKAIVQCTMCIRFVFDKGKWNRTATTTNSMTRIGEQFKEFDTVFPNKRNASSVFKIVMQQVIKRWEEMSK